MLAYEIRGALPSDEAALLELANHLNTVNLPHDRESIAKLLARSEASFTGKIQDPLEREYVFVLVDCNGGRLIGTSMIIGQLGRRAAPYIYLDVGEDERYSATLDRHFRHTTLSIGYSYDGPTEIGGLVVLPEYRRVPERLGQCISYVRFLYIKMFRPLFRDELLAELLPPLEPDGTSHLWNALGRKFTGLSYAEADRLSKSNKEFIKGLFPEGTIYASLLSEAAQGVVGKVGLQTRGVEKMLKRIGFAYCDRVDPFDGGPHFIAETDDVTLVERTTERRVEKLVGPEKRVKTRSLVATALPDPPYFRAVLGRWHPIDEVSGAIDEVAARHLGITAGAQVWVLELD